MSTCEGKLTKKEKGRWKKLKKRASLTLDPSCASSSTGGGGSSSGHGITTFSDAIELKDLWNRTNSKPDEGRKNKNKSNAFPFGPSIQYVNHKGKDKDGAFSDPDLWRHTEGCDHRDLILSVLFQEDANTNANNNHTKEQKSKKRKRRDDGNHKLPTWARLHNPTLAESIAVVEIAIPSSSCYDSGAIMPSYRVKNQSQESGTEGVNSSIISKLISKDGYNGRKALPLRCGMFQGDMPRHATDTFMYLEDKSSSSSSFPKKSKVETDQTDGNEIQTDDDCSDTQKVLRKLSSLVLTVKDMKKEKYPLIRTNDHVMKKGKGNILTGDVEPISIPPSLLEAAKSHESSKNDGEYELPFGSEESLKVVQSLKVELAYKLIPEDCNEKIEEETENGNDIETKSPIFVSTCIDRSQIFQPSDAASFKVYSLDCEMVKTTETFELARVTLLEFCPTANDIEGYKVVLDKLVKPKNRVVDYVTAYSGITPSMLQNVTISLEEVQAALLSIICKDDIIVGQSLENDLRALHLVHTNVVDTAVLFSTDGRKHSLKHLSSCLLKKKIQSNAETGHCSEEDAAAALSLAVRRARLGDQFCLHERKAKKNLLTVITNARKDSGDYMPMYLQLNNGPLVCLGPNEWIRDHILTQSNAHALECSTLMSSSVNASSSFLRPGSRRASFLWSKLLVCDADEKEINSKIDEVLGDILSKSLPSTLVFVVFQRGYNKAKYLWKERQGRKNQRSTLGWTPDDESHFLEAVDVAKKCEVLWIGASNVDSDRK